MSILPHKARQQCNGYFLTIPKFSASEGAVPVVGISRPTIAGPGGCLAARFRLSPVYPMLSDEYVEYRAHRLASWTVRGQRVIHVGVRVHRDASVRRQR